MSDPVKILLVDDNPVVLAGLSEMLRAAGYRVTEARNGEACVYAALEESPDLILLDVVLPDGNGVELCRRLKAMAELESAFVVLLSSVQTLPSLHKSALPPVHAPAVHTSLTVQASPSLHGKALGAC